MITVAFCLFETFFFLVNYASNCFLVLCCAQARYSILRSCLQELARKGLIHPPFALAEEPPPQQGEEGARVSAGAIGADCLHQWARHREGGTTVDGDDTSSSSSSDRKQREDNKSGGNSFGGVTLEENLLAIADKCEGYSGRALRKLPLRAHALYLQRRSVSVEQYLRAMEKAIHQQERNQQSAQMLPE